MKIYLLRHGETDWNSKSLIQGQVDIPLNEYGRELAMITSKEMKDIPFDRMYHSPLKRAEETARIMKADRDIPLICDERLKEMNFGAEEGGYIPDLYRMPENPLYNFLNQPDQYIPAFGGETFEEVYSRSSEFMKECILPLEQECENILIVAHGAWNRTVLNAVAGIPVSDFWKIRLKNCAVSILSLEKGELTVEEEGKIFYESTPAESGATILN